MLGALAQMERELIVQRVKAGLARAKAEGRHIGRKKTRPSAMIRKVLIRGATFREASHLCQSSQGSISLEAKEMRQEFRSGKIPEHLTINDVKGSPFFASEDRKYFEQITENLIQEQLKIKKDDVPPVSGLKEPVAEMQPVSTIVKHAA